MTLGTLELSQFMDSESFDQMDESSLVTMLYNMLCSVNFLHAMGVIHRDIKPSNFLLDAFCGITLCDFGLSRALPRPTETETQIEEYRQE